MLERRTKPAASVFAEEGNSTMSYQALYLTALVIGSAAYYGALTLWALFF